MDWDLFLKEIQTHPNFFPDTLVWGLIVFGVGFFGIKLIGCFGYMSCVHGYFWMYVLIVHFTNSEFCCDEKKTHACKRNLIFQVSSRVVFLTKLSYQIKTKDTNGVKTMYFLVEENKFSGWKLSSILGLPTSYYSINTCFALLKVTYTDVSCCNHLNSVYAKVYLFPPGRIHAVTWPITERKLYHHGASFDSFVSALLEIILLWTSNLTLDCETMKCMQNFAVFFKGKRIWRLIRLHHWKSALKCNEVLFGVCFKKWKVSRSL